MSTSSDGRYGGEDNTAATIPTTRSAVLFSLTVFPPVTGWRARQLEASETDSEYETVPSSDGDSARVTLHGTPAGGHR